MQYVKSGRESVKQGGTAGYSPVPAKEVFAWTGFFITPDPARKKGKYAISVKYDRHGGEKEEKP